MWAGYIGQIELSLLSIEMVNSIFLKGVIICPLCSDTKGNLTIFVQREINVRYYRTFFIGFFGISDKFWIHLNGILITNTFQFEIKIFSDRCEMLKSKKILKASYIQES